MLTVKIVFANGQESVFSAGQTNWRPKDKTLITDNETSYVLPGGAVAYVMNARGDTIARYSNEIKAY